MALSIAKVQTTDRLVNQLQNNIIDSLKPLTSNAQNQGSILTNVALVIGVNSISHGLGEPLTGWTIIRQRSAGSVYDMQDSNPTPQTTLVLVASVAVNVNIYVF